jgi:hypothetical protein
MLGASSPCVSFSISPRMIFVSIGLNGLRGSSEFELAATAAPSSHLLNRAVEAQLPLHASETATRGRTERSKASARGATSSAITSNHT